MAQTGKRRPAGVTARPPRTAGARPSAATRPPSGPGVHPGVHPSGSPGNRGRQPGTRPPVSLLRGSTRRLVVLGGVFVMLAIMLVPTVRAYFAQRDANSALAIKVAQQQRTVDELQRDIDRYNDPAYVEQQARSRLGMVKPGETAWKVVGTTPDDQAGRPPAGVVIPPAGPGQRAYYERLWTSLQLTDRAPEGRARSPGAGAGSPAPR